MQSTKNSEKLNYLIHEAGILNNKLILIVGSSSLEKSKLVEQFSATKNTLPINIGIELGYRLASTAKTKRSFSVSELLREIADINRNSALIILNNIELLFETSLQVDPLELIKKLSHSKPVVAIWPGELRGDRLIYADMSHPEYRDYSREGVVVLEI